MQYIIEHMFPSGHANSLPLDDNQGTAPSHEEQLNKVTLDITHDDMAKYSLDVLEPSVYEFELAQA